MHRRFPDLPAPTRLVTNKEMNKENENIEAIHSNIIIIISIMNTNIKTASNVTNIDIMMNILNTFLKLHTKLLHAEQTNVEQGLFNQQRCLAAQSLLASSVGPPWGQA